MQFSSISGKDQRCIFSGFFKTNLKRIQKTKLNPLNIMILKDTNLALGIFQIIVSVSIQSYYDSLAIVLSINYRHIIYWHPQTAIDQSPETEKTEKGRTSHHKRRKQSQQVTASVASVATSDRKKKRLKEET